MITQLAQSILSGLLMGGIYGLIAFGLSLVFGVMRLTNFAHGDLLMIAMYLSVTIWTTLGIQPYISIVLVGLILFALGYFIQKYTLNPILKKDKAREPVRVRLFTIGLSIFLQNFVLMFMGGAPKSLTIDFSSATTELGNLIFSLPRVLAFVISMLITIGLWFFIQKTDTGRAMRAVSQDRNTALLMGINEYKTYSFAFGIGAALLGLAASIIAPFMYVYPSIGSGYTLRSFIIVALGGIGSIPGALVGGLLVGVIEGVSAQFMAASYSEVVVFIIFILVLSIKPSGIFGNEKQ